MLHSFHIPVLGLGFSIDTPLKVARYGISSVVSIVDDELTERMRQYHSTQNNIDFVPIGKSEQDSRERRITAYLNLLDQLVNEQFEQMQQQPFTGKNDIDRYFNLLPASSQLRQGYELMMQYPEGESKRIFEEILRQGMKKGAIDVNIMAKVDKVNYNAHGQNMGDENTDALIALRAFGSSNLNSSVVLSAGMNTRLYSYLESFKDFFPDQLNNFKKKIILKVSDFRSALIQARFLAKKGLWVSEFRIESGLNCGGHAFATDGLLLGPILDEFKQRRAEMLDELWKACQVALLGKGYILDNIPAQRISVQGGIGTGNENSFLLNYYGMDATGWGSPFLLVPETTNVDTETLTNLTEADHSDFYLSKASPLGVLFNNFRKSSAEKERLARIAKGRPGSACTKKYLCADTEFTEQPICTASREYQHLKLRQLSSLLLTENERQAEFDVITEKVCLCEGLAASAYIVNDILKRKESKAVTICPGPNIAYFKDTYSLDEMIAHIYGEINLLDKAERPNMFINELKLYVDYLEKNIVDCARNLNDKRSKYLMKFKEQLQNGIDYYKELLPQITNQTHSYIESMYRDLRMSEKKLCTLQVPHL
jgi:hypothetical protein